MQNAARSCNHSLSLPRSARDWRRLVGPRQFYFDHRKHRRLPHPHRRRRPLLHRAAALLVERNDVLARLEAQDTGKPIQETIAVDLLSGADCIEYYAGLARTIAGEHHDLGAGAFGYSRREPLGVVAGIGAWNYPIQIAC